MTKKLNHVCDIRRPYLRHSTTNWPQSAVSKTATRKKVDHKGENEFQNRQHATFLEREVIGVSSN